MNSSVLTKNVFFEVTVTLTFDLWPTNSNQFTSESSDCDFILCLQIWERYQASHITLNKTVNISCKMLNFKSFLGGFLLNSWGSWTGTQLVLCLYFNFIEKLCGKYDYSFCFEGDTDLLWWFLYVTIADSPAHHGFSTHHLFLMISFGVSHRYSNVTKKTVVLTHH